jgi:hypothetical protein
MHGIYVAVDADIKENAGLRWKIWNGAPRCMQIKFREQPIAARQRSRRKPSDEEIQILNLIAYTIINNFSPNISM